MSLGLFDSHCHLENERFEQDAHEVLQRMAEEGVTRCLLAGSDMQTSRQIVELCSDSSVMYGAVGIHPHEAKFFTQADVAQLTRWLTLERIVALGEIGLDYYYDHSPRAVQMEVLDRQVQLAYELQTPVLFHVRDAHGDMLAYLQARRDRLPAGVLHCYSGSVDSARQYLDMGFYLSFAGPLTFKNAAHGPEVAKFCPGDRFLIETDSPYLAPEPMRGRRNEPAYVRYVAQRLADLRGVSLKDIARQSAQNACRLFGIAE